MHKMLLLTKTLLKSGGVWSTQKNTRAKWLIPLVLLFAFASFGLSIAMMTFGLYDALAKIGASYIILPLAFGAVSIMIFFFGIFYVIAIMYHADDIELLLSLPVRPYQLLGAKFLTLVVYEYVVEAFLLLPMLVSFGIKSAAGVLYYLYSALLFLVVPVIALAMAAVIVMVVMRFTNFGKNKQAFKFVGAIIAMALAIGLNVAIQTTARNITSAQITAIMTGQSSLVSILGRIFPGITFASDALIHSAALEGLGNLLLYLLCSFGAILVFIGLGQLLYVEGVIGVSESSAKRKAVKDLGRSTESTPVIKSYVKKEIRLLMRSPIAFMNCVLINFIWPIILVIMVMGGGNEIQLSSLIPLLDKAVLFAILVGISAFVSCSNAVTSTAISREGRSFYFMKYIPTSYKKQLTAKAITGIMLSSIAVVSIAVVGIVIGADLLVVLLAMIVGIAVAASGSVAGLLIDIAHPKLEWMNEQQAVKQNMNVLLHMLVGLLFAAVAIVPVLLLKMALLPAVLYNLFAFLLILLLIVKFANRIAGVKLDAINV